MHSIISRSSEKWHGTKGDHMKPKEQPPKRFCYWRQLSWLGICAHSIFIDVFSIDVLLKRLSTQCQDKCCRMAFCATVASRLRKASWHLKNSFPRIIISWTKGLRNQMNSVENRLIAPLFCMQEAGCLNGKPSPHCPQGLFDSNWSMVISDKMLVQVFLVSFNSFPIDMHVFRSTLISRNILRHHPTQELCNVNRHPRLSYSLVLRMSGSQPLHEKRYIMRATSIDWWYPWLPWSGFLVHHLCCLAVGNMRVKASLNTWKSKVNRFLWGSVHWVVSRPVSVVDIEYFFVITVPLGFLLKTNLFFFQAIRKIILLIY